MLEKKRKLLTKEFIEKFLQEAQSHSGLPVFNDISIYYMSILASIEVPDNLLDYTMDSFLNNYMKVTHISYIRNKTWKSYDD